MSPNALAPEGGCSADQWFTTRRFALLLALLIVASFPDVVTGRGTFFHRDFSLFGYPLAGYFRECFWRGEFPHWTPLNYCGLPFLAQWNTLTLYPLSLIYLVLPLSWSLGAFCLGHLYLAGLGMYALVFHWTENRFAAAVGGIAFTFNALMLNFLMWPNNIAAMAWLPWVVLTVERAWREGGRRVLLAALAGTMQMLSGAPEVILLTWLWLAARWIQEVMPFKLSSRQPQSERGDSTKAPPSQATQDVIRTPRSALFRRMTAIVLLIAALSAAQLLPFLELLTHSQRDSSFDNSDWAMPLWGWANFLVPLFRALPTPAGVYGQPEQYWIFSYYLGIGTLVFALLGTLQMRRIGKPAALLALLAGVCLLLALGEHGYLYAAMRHALPAMGFMRFPVKFVILPAFLLPLLAAGFVAHCLTLTPSAWLKQRRQILTLFGVLSLGIGFIVWAAFQFPLKQISASVAALSGASRAALLALMVMALLAARQVQQARIRTFLRVALLLLLWLDVMTMGPRPNPTVALEVYESGLVRREGGMMPIPRIGESRVLLSTEAELSLNSVTLSNNLEQVLYSRLGLQGNANLLEEVPIVAGLYSLHLREVGDVLQVLYDTPEPPVGLADFLAVSLFNAPGKITERHFRPTHLPWVTAGQKPAFATPTNILHALGQANFNPRETVYLPLEVRDHVTVSNVSTPKITVREFTAHRARIEIEASEPALLIIAQSFYHNWRAKVDGQPVPLLRANHAFQALETPAGRHTVTLTYKDRAFNLGALISITTLLVCVLVWWRGRKPSATHLSTSPTPPS